MSNIKAHVGGLKQDLFTIAQSFNAFRQNIFQYIITQGLDPKDKALDPFNLFEGGSGLTKQFNKDWQLAAKIAARQGNLSVMEYANNDHTGFNLKVGGIALEEVSRAFHWIPGVATPNKWTGNKFSTNKRSTTLLLSFACNFDGSIRQIWAAIVPLASNQDGKSGDWKFSAHSETAGFSSFTLTQEVFGRPDYIQVIGDLDYDYSERSGDAKQGMKLDMSKIPADVTGNIGKTPVLA